MTMHFISRRDFLCDLGAAAIASTSVCGATARATPQREPRVLFVSRAGAYEPEIVRRTPGALNPSERRMTALGREIGVEVECRNNCDVFDGDLERYDGFVLFWNFDPTKPNKAGESPITPRGKQRLLDAVASGKGLLGIHCAAYAFLSGKQEQWQPREQCDPYTQMLGGELCGCLAKQKCRYRVVSPRFPGIDQLKTPEFVLDDEPYGLKNFADDIHVIAVFETEGLDMTTRKDKTFPRPPFPCVWARNHQRGRVFYLSMGHGEDTWQTKPFQQVVRSGLQWTLGRVDAELTPNLESTAPNARKLP